MCCYLKRAVSSLALLQTSDAVDASVSRSLLLLNRSLLTRVYPRPEFVRRYAKLTKAFGLSADVGLAPPRAKPMGKYVHDGAEESLADLKRAVSSLTLLQVCC